MINRLKVKLTFGASLVAWRKHRGYTQDVLAETSGLHRTYISDVERGFRNISLISITRLAKALGVSVPELFQPPPPPASPALNLKPANAKAGIAPKDLI